jgi:hypothetical protein
MAERVLSEILDKARRRSPSFRHDVREAAEILKARGWLFERVADEG